MAWTECGCCRKRFEYPAHYAYWTHICWRMFLEHPRYWTCHLVVAWQVWRHPELCKDME
jgi:hypothetical protein